ncbi:MAG: imidazole glycerol phosphate synthase subunit HisH [Proteobacteria bacterium]|nr:imidazole glycerol phosphate synthase subunit HisH [Pseudomonadota bacterium]
MSARVAIVDYGLGNLFSVCQAVARCGAEPELTAEPGRVRAAGRLILPGVGAFADGMAGLRARGLDAAVRAAAAAGRPLLGICLGMQMLFAESEEFGRHQGLGLIPGRVVAIPPSGADGKPHKIPHIGWNGLIPAGGRSGWEGTPLRALAPATAVYFVHSFVADPAEPADRLAECDYDGLRLTAAVGRGNVVGLQFHPERSGPAGLAVIAAFLDGGAGDG